MTKLTRRNFIKGSLVAGVAIGLTPALLRAADKNIPIGVQLYSVRDDCGKDFDVALARIAKMGFTGVEFAGYHKYNGKAKELRQKLDDLGLKGISTHIGTGSIRPTELQKTIEFHQIIGCKYLIIPGDGDFTDPDKSLKLAETFNKAAESLKPLGMSCGYHNHTKEFTKIGDSTYYDLFAARTTDDVVLEQDCGWSASAGLQPAELMKVALVLALARFYQWLPTDRISHPVWVALPLMLIAAPVTLVLKQPDLGTAILIMAAGIGVMFLAGVRPAYFIAGAVCLAALGELIWPHLQEYQRRRLLTFIDPERDPLGAGYHIAQSKIALGSGGLNGRGFLGGTQSQLNFLPEKHTDFIFTMFAEETGFAGALALMALYAALIGCLLVMAFRARSPSARLLAAGMAVVFALHVTVNIGMVIGLLPVVGVPLPLVSYGGTSMLTLMFGLGLALTALVHRADPPRREQLGALF